jgi:hypothetical protein
MCVLLLLISLHNLRNPFMWSDALAELASPTSESSTPHCQDAAGTVTPPLRHHRLWQDAAAALPPIVPLSPRAWGSELDLLPDAADTSPVDRSDSDTDMSIASATHIVPYCPNRFAPGLANEWDVCTTLATRTPDEHLDPEVFQIAKHMLSTKVADMTNTAEAISLKIDRKKLRSTRRRTAAASLIQEMMAWQTLLTATIHMTQTQPRKVTAHLAFEFATYDGVDFHLQANAHVEIPTVGNPSMPSILPSGPPLQDGDLAIPNIPDRVTITAGGKATKILH